MRFLMPRRLKIAALALALALVALFPGSAAAYFAGDRWSPSDSNTLQSYTFNTSSPFCPATYRLRVEFDLGKVTATTVFIKYIRLYWSQLSNIDLIVQADPYTTVWDNFGTTVRGDDNLIHPDNGTNFNFYVSKTLRFDHNNSITFERTDYYLALSGCDGHRVFDVTVSAT